MVFGIRRRRACLGMPTDGGRWYLVVEVGYTRRNTKDKNHSISLKINEILLQWSGKRKSHLFNSSNPSILWALQGVWQTYIHISPEREMECTQRHKILRETKTCINYITVSNKSQTPPVYTTGMYTGFRHTKWPIGTISRFFSCGMVRK